MLTKTTSGSSALQQEPESVYFSANPAPASLPKNVSLARDFLNLHASVDGRKVVLITSGGTTVPLEEQTVRFIDNFSAGTRGATSAEYFLEMGYAVIFLHRQYSLLPYSRHYSHNTKSFLDYMVNEQILEGVDPGHTTDRKKNFIGSGDNCASNGAEKVAVAYEHQDAMMAVLNKYLKVKRDRTLLILSFVTVNEYLWSLRELAKLMRPLGPRAVFYLAAAVSDFFIPKDRLVKHKIQSSEEFSGYNNYDHKQKNSDQSLPAARTEGKKLVIDLEPVPKFLKSLVDGWAPQGMIVSFKLETDPSILVAKARHSLEKYAHHLVIGNLLSTRKWEVVFVSPAGESWIRVPQHRRTRSVSGIPALVGKAGGFVGADADHEMTDSPVDDGSSEDDVATFEHESLNGIAPAGEPALEIESLIIPEITKMHAEHIARAEHDS